LSWCVIDRLKCRLEDQKDGVRERGDPEEGGLDGVGAEGDVRGDLGGDLIIGDRNY